MVVQAYNTSTQEAKTVALWILGHSGLYSKTVLENQNRSILNWKYGFIETCLSCVNPAIPKEKLVVCWRYSYMSFCGHILCSNYFKVIHYLIKQQTGRWHWSTFKSVSLCWADKCHATAGQIPRNVLCDLARRAAATDLQPQPYFTSLSLFSSAVVAFSLHAVVKARGTQSVKIVGRC